MEKFWTPTSEPAKAVLETDTGEFFGFRSAEAARNYCRMGGGYIFGVWRLKGRKA